LEYNTDTLKKLLNSIINTKISLEEFLILYCLYSKNKELLINYVSNCKKINTDIFKKLKDEDYIIINDFKDNNIYYELLSLTENGLQQVLKVVSEVTLNSHISENNFEEFRKFYPSVVKDGFRTRRLHNDLKRSKNSYDKLLLETTHDILCKSAKLYHNEMIKSNSEYYMQNLSTWLNQANYKQYLDTINNNNNNKINNPETNVESI
jgi:hypothetical protein